MTLIRVGNRWCGPTCCGPFAVSAGAGLPVGPIPGENEGDPAGDGNHRNPVRSVPDMTATASAAAAGAILAALALFQLALAAGAPLGRFAWGGAHERLPRRLRIASAASIFLYAVFAFVLLDRAGVADVLPDGASRIAAWVLTAYFVLGILMNAISRSRSERLVMTPVAVILAVLSAIVAVSA